MLDWKYRHDLKELELNALLEITQAINNNLPEESLYKIYSFTIRANLLIRKFALYVLDDSWDCKVNFGTEKDFFKIPLDEKFRKVRPVRKMDHWKNPGPFSEFGIVIPVAHKNNLLAVVFLAGDGMTGDGMTGEGPGEVDTNFIQTLSNIILVAIENKKLARKELKQEALRRELEIARNVQQNLFPKQLPRNNDLYIHASYLPHQVVGGDYYDYIPIDEHQFMICIADVSGKGIPASLLMSNFQASLRAMAHQTNKFEKIIRDLNSLVLGNSNGENFITFFSAIYNRKEKYFKYVNAGHNPPFFYSPATGHIDLDSGTTVLGILHPLPFLNIGKIRDVSGFSFLSFTDGLTETFNDQNEQFGAERVKDLFIANYNQVPEDLHALVIEQVKQFRNNREFEDDITILSCRMK